MHEVEASVNFKIWSEWKIAVVFACLACATHGRRLHRATEQVAGIEDIENQEPLKSLNFGLHLKRSISESSKALAMLLEVSAAASSFMPAALVRPFPKSVPRAASPPQMGKIYYQGDYLLQDPEATASFGSTQVSLQEAGDDVCSMLPHDDFLGEKPALVGGEMEFVELEHNTNVKTQLWLHENGTVTLGMTTGLPPIEYCGFWQCGSSQFQMTLQRKYSDDLSMTTDPEKIYSMVRTFTGFVDPASTGMSIVRGSVHLYNHEADADADLGYFMLHGNTYAMDEMDAKVQVEEFDPDDLWSENKEQERLDKEFEDRLKNFGVTDLDHALELEDDADGSLSAIVKLDQTRELEDDADGSSSGMTNLDQTLELEDDANGSSSGTTDLDQTLELEDDADGSSSGMTNLDQTLELEDAANGSSRSEPRLQHPSPNFDQ